MHSGETETLAKPVVKTKQKSAPDAFVPTSSAVATFADRHIAPSAEETVQMLRDRKSTRLNSSHTVISYAVFCLKKKKSEDAFTHAGLDVADRLRDTRS